MPSLALQQWKTERTEALDEIASTNTKVGGSKRGRRFATEQINQAYAVLLSSQFQGFCRALHSECVTNIVGSILPVSLQNVVRLEFVRGRKLDHGNPNTGNIGADFNRFGFSFWSDVMALNSRNTEFKSRLDQLNTWRNAIAHQAFDPRVLGSNKLRLNSVTQWRKACNTLANSFDTVMATHLISQTGTSAW